MKDLIRALRADDSRCEIRRELGQARVLQKVIQLCVACGYLVRMLILLPIPPLQDLLSILVCSADDTVLRNDVIRSVQMEYKILRVVCAYAISNVDC